MVHGAEGSVKDFSRSNWVVPFTEIGEMKGGICFLKRESKRLVWDLSWRCT